MKSVHFLSVNKKKEFIKKKYFSLHFHQKLDLY